MGSSELEDNVKIGKLILGKVTYGWLLTAICGIGYMFAIMDGQFLGIALPTLSKTFKFTAADASYMFAAVYVFAALLAAFLGPLADRIGRKPVFQITLVGTGVFSVITSFLGAFWQLVIVRILAGVGIDASLAPNALISEEAPPRWRGAMMGTMQAGYPFGAALASTLAAVILPNWRILFYIAFAPALFIILASSLFRESPYHIKESKEKRIPYGSLPGNVKRQILIMAFFTGSEACGATIMATFMTLYLVDFGHFSIQESAIIVAISLWGALISQVGVGFLSDHIPSKWLLVIGSIGGAVGLFMFLNVSTFGMILLAACLTTFFGMGAYGCVYRYTAESCPTQYRASGVFWSQIFTDIIFAGLPLISGYFFTIKQPVLMFVVAGGLTGIGGILLWIFGANIKPQKLLEHIQMDLAEEVPLV